MFQIIKNQSKYKILGILIDKFGVEEIQLENCIEKIENILSIWNDISIYYYREGRTHKNRIMK